VVCTNPRYILIALAAGIALASIAVVNGLGTNLNDKFSQINTSLK
jgi:pilus assembly protein Flp/PilA